MKDTLTVADDLLFNTVEKFKRLDKANVADGQERARYELKIYQSYFSILARLVENPHSDGKKETAREYVGQHIHPGYTLMPDAIFLFTNHAVLLPMAERDDYLSTLRELMLLIGVRWHDAELAALNVQARIDELMAVDVETTKKISQSVADQLMADFKRHEQALRDCLKSLAETLLSAPAARTDKTLAAINATRETLRAEIADVRADTTAAAINSFKAKTTVEDLLALRLQKRAENKERGTINQANGNTEADERAARDMQAALNRVRDRIKNGAKNVLGECRTVCKEFEPLTTKKNAMGKYEAYAPLTGANDEPIKPETLAKNYRKRFGTKKANKAKTARALKSKRREK